MAWIKRNLFFAIGGIIALLLLGAAGYYGFRAWSDNSSKMGQLEEAYSDLRNYLTQNPSPGNDQVDNIKAAEEQAHQLRKWIKEAQTHFKVIPPIPNAPDGNVTTEQFAGSLRQTIRDMQEEATNANVGLPPDYCFSFAAERNLVMFAPNSLNPLASHLGEVKAICEVLFAAKVNSLDGIQREIVSDNDAAGPQSDFLADKTQTEGVATVTPYVVTFHCFSSDLAEVLSRFASSDYCFVVKGINVLPSDQTAGAPGEVASQTAPTMAGGAMSAGNHGLQTVLDEKLLQITLAIEVVKLAN